MTPRDLKHLPSVLTAHSLVREVLYERARREFRPLNRAESLAVEVVDSSFDLVWREAERRLAHRARKLDQFSHDMRRTRREVAA
jgi:hypothetical protein